MTDRNYMALALELAELGVGWTAPNPMVGAVVVKDGEIIGQGYHAKYGQLHAERAALATCSASPGGAVMYVTLEPCCHQGRQPPCTQAILEAGIARVVVGSYDPNPLVAGKGIALLRERGVEVVTGVLQEECDALNQVFFHFIRTGRPYVTIKYAMTMDGKIATVTGKSQWITGVQARQRVHWDRHRFSAILVGVGTVLADDPQLTCRMEGGKNPLRLVCDTWLRTPSSAQVVKTAGEIPTVLATCCTEKSRWAAYQAAGCQVWVLPQRSGHVDLNALMDRLGKEQIDSVLLEGGGTLNWAALEAGVVQKVQTYIAPKLFGGVSAKSPVEGAGVREPGRAVRLVRTTIACVGEDFLLESEVESSVYRNC